MSDNRITYPTAKELRDFTDATSLNPALVIRDIVRIAELFHLLDQGFLGAKAVLTGGMAMRLLASTRISLRDLDIAVVGTEATTLTVSDLEQLLAYTDPGVTISPRKVDEWPRRDLYQAAPLLFAHRFSRIRLGGGDSWLKVDVSLRGTVLASVPVPFKHGYPFRLGVEGEIVQVMHPVEILAEKAVAYGIFRLPKHLADLAYMGTRLPKLLGLDNWLSTNASGIRRVAGLKFDANLELHPKIMAEQEIGVFDDMRESFDHPERFGVAAGWSSAVFFHGDAATLFTFPNAQVAVQARIVPILWPDANP